MIGVLLFLWQDFHSSWAILAHLCAGEAYQLGVGRGDHHRDLAEEVVAGLHDFWVWALMLVCGLHDLLEDGAGDGSIGSCGLYDEWSDVRSEGLSIRCDIVVCLHVLSEE
jgi:hypothetical protein